MRRGTWLQRAPGLLFLAALAFLVCACGGGGKTTEGSTTSGKVAILLTDGPSNDFNHIWVTITGIDLLGDGAQVPIFSGNRTVDLLDLRADSMLLDIASDVPAGVYEKIRLRVSKLVLEEPDGTEVDVPVPANGKIDLNPRSPFLVEPGATVVIELDLDAAKSIHIVSNGNGKHGDRYRFRPVVFVSVRTRLPDGKLTRLQGTIEQVDTLEGWFLLNPTANDTDTGDTADNDGGDLDARWIKVQTGADTSFFGDDGLEIGFADLRTGDVVTAVGGFQSFFASQDWSDNGGYPVFDAVLIERGTFQRLWGTVVTAPGAATGAFVFAVDPGQGLSGDLTVDAQLVGGTRYFWRSGGPATFADLLPGTRLRLDAVILLPGDPPAPTVTTLRVALAMLEPSDAVLKLEGSVVSVDLSADLLTVLTADLATHETVLPDAARVFLIQETAGSYDIKVGTQADIAPLEQVVLFGKLDGLGRFVVEDVFILLPPPVPPV